MKNLLLALLLLLIMLFNLSDIFADISLGVSTAHIIEEVIVVLLTAIGAGYLLFERYQQRQELAELNRQLSSNSQQLKNMSEQMRTARRQYSEAIEAQFDAWQLTQSEQQVALLLLKGLSFKEMALIRQTKEKTIRQQASNIYAKSGVDGRHEFAAWFMEDFLSAQ
jgi:DNA-binding NarL/FixJ family response regulator